MKPSLQPGVSLTRRLVVDRDRTIALMGEHARVYSTASMIYDMERACRDLILTHAEPGEDSVGIDVAVRHLAATLPGMTIEISAWVTAVDGRKVTFEVSARDDIEPIGEGTHAEFVVDVGRTVERLKAKAAKWGQTAK